VIDFSVMQKLVRFFSSLYKEWGFSSAVLDEHLQIIELNSRANNACCENSHTPLILLLGLTRDYESNWCQMYWCATSLLLSC
jgi:hypothetical protein